MRMTQLSRSAALAIRILPLLLVVAGCTGEQPAPPLPGSGAVRALMSHDPPSLSLLGKADRNSEILAYQITDSLVQFDPGMELQPRVASSWELSGDGRTFTFRLRDGVRWHDGRPVTAADVLFSVELARDPAVENRIFGSQFDGLASLEAPDDSTVVARYAEPGADLLEAWRLPLLPRHLAERGAELLTGSYASHPVGCGPFRFVRYRPGEEIVLEANDDYWDGRPTVDRLTFRIYPDQRTGFQALLKGDLDIMVVTPDLWREALEGPHAERFGSLVYYRLNVWQIGLNQDGSNPFFADARVRRALLHAVDRDRFIDNVLHGLARPAVTTYHPDLPWTDRGIAPVRFDPEAAARLLDEAGWTDRDGDGVRERDGRPFEFTLLIFTSTQGINDDMAAWLQQSWSDLGVRAEIEKLEWQHFRARRAEHRFEAAMAGISFTPSPDHFELYHSSASRGGYNHVSFADAEVDRLLERGRSVTDPDERREIYRELQRRLHDLQPIMALLHFATPVLHDRRLQGIQPSPLDYWRTTGGPRSWRWSGAAEGD
jgi:peptide/nickel transport system substrate-binding protein